MEAFHMKRIIIFLGLIFFAFWCCFAEQAKVAIVLSSDIEPYRIALRGFDDYFKEKKMTLSVSEYNLQKEDASAVFSKIKNEKPNIILTVGTKATKEAKDKINDIPIIFSMILDPSEFTGPKATGVSLKIPPEMEIKILKSIIPKVKKIGVIYSKESQADVNKATLSCQSLNLELVSTKVESEEQVPKAIRDIIKNIDALFMIADSVVYTKNSTQDILLTTLREGIPVFGISPQYVKAGAVFCLSCDYEDIGKQTGEIALKVLSGTSPSDIPVNYPRKTLLFLNLVTAQRIGIEIPKEIFDKAKEVYK